MEIDTREGPRHQQSSAYVRYLNRQGDWLEKTRGNLVVAATVIASMSFQIIVNPPGGVWQNDNCSSEDSNCKKLVGTSVLEHSPSKRLYYIGMVSTSLASFSASMSLILLVITGFGLRNRLIMAMLVMFMVVAVLCISAAFGFTVLLVHTKDDTLYNVMTVGLWVVFPVVVILIQLIGFVQWLFCSCSRRRRHSTPPLMAPSPAS